MIDISTLNVRQWCLIMIYIVIILLESCEKQPTLNFRRTVARQLIANRFIPKASEVRKSHLRQAKKQKVGTCKLVSLPKFKCFSGTDIVDCNGAYNQYRCVCQKMRVRTYCECSPGFIRCQICFVTHSIDVQNE